MNYLTPHFTLEELTRSEVAARHGIDNTPPPEVVANLKRLAEMLEEIRMLVGVVYVNSAYRCLQVNTLVGSKPTSDHVIGLAADIVCPAYGSPDHVIRTIMASPISYKQVIREFDSWTHIASPKEGEEAKREALIIDKTGTRFYS